MTETKIPRETIRDKVDKLINWYEQNKPGAGKRIEVNCSRKDFAKTFCDWTQDQIKIAKHDDIPRETKYRGRDLFTLAP